MTHMHPLAPPFPCPDPSNGFLADHFGLLRHSYRRLTGRDLIDPGLIDRAAARALFEAPFALLSHDTQADPILTYGNRTVLRLFEVDVGATDRHAVALHGGGARSGGAGTTACGGCRRRALSTTIAGCGWRRAGDAF